MNSLIRHIREVHGFSSGFSCKDCRFCDTSETIVRGHIQGRHSVDSKGLEGEFTANQLATWYRVKYQEEEPLVRDLPSAAFWDWDKTENGGKAQQPPSPEPEPVQPVAPSTEPLPANTTETSTSAPAQQTHSPEALHQNPPNLEEEAIISTPAHQTHSPEPQAQNVTIVEEEAVLSAPTKPLSAGRCVQCHAVIKPNTADAAVQHLSAAHRVIIEVDFRRVADAPILFSGDLSQSEICKPAKDPDDPQFFRVDEVDELSSEDENEGQKESEQEEEESSTLRSEANIGDGNKHNDAHLLPVHIIKSL